MGWKWFGLSFVVLACFLGSSNSFAGIDVVPSVQLTERYNDNIDLDDEDEESDLITRITPSIALILNNPWVDGTLDYGFYFLFYLENTDRNETSLRDTQRADLDLLFFPNRVFTIKVADEYSRERINSRDEDIEENESTNRANRNRFEIRPRYRRDFSTWVFDVDYGYINEDFDSSAGNDSDEHGGGLRIEKILSPRLTVFALGRYEDFRADLSSDFTSVTAGAGLSYLFGPDWRFTLSAEPEWIDFEDDNSEFIFGINSEVRKTTDRTEFFLAYSRAQEQSNDDDGSFREDDIRAGYGATGRWEPSVEAFYTNSQFLNTDREDSRYGVILRLVLNVTSNLSYWGELKASHLQFDPEDEDVDRYGGAIGVDYLWKRFVFSLDGRYRTSNSSNDADDYDNVIIQASASWTY